MQSSVMSCHPNILAFIKVLQLEQGLNDVHITQMIAGRPPPPQCRQSAARITTIVSDYANRNAMDFSQTVAQHYFTIGAMYRVIRVDNM